MTGRIGAADGRGGRRPPRRLDMTTTALPAEVDVAVIGAGAAGIGAGRRLAAAGASFVVLEARDRLGGRAWTRIVEGLPIDVGCGWLHSGDRNPWTAIAEASGFAVDRAMPPWGRQTAGRTFTDDEQLEFRAARDRFYERLEASADVEPDRPAAALLEPGSRWNKLLDSICTWINGAELDRVSARDWGRYEDSEVNWRVREGYGAVIAAHGAGLPVAFGTAVTRVDHGGTRIKLATAGGTIAARAAIVTVPTTLIAAEALRVDPPLPDKVDAAAVLPLGLADKLVLALDDPGLVPESGHLFGRIDGPTASYHLRPYGRPTIEAYFGGRVAASLEREGDAGFVAFALDQLAFQLGESVRGKLRPLSVSAWGRDEWARGSYSHALPGHADARAVLAAPVDDRLFFAGEACSRGSFSTAHGAYETGRDAAEQALAALGVRR